MAITRSYCWGGRLFGVNALHAANCIAKTPAPPPGPPPLRIAASRLPTPSTISSGSIRPQRQIREALAARGTPL